MRGANTNCCHGWTYFNCCRIAELRVTAARVRCTICLPRPPFAARATAFSSKMKTETAGPGAQLLQRQRQRHCSLKSHETPRARWRAAASRGLAAFGTLRRTPAEINCQCCAPTGRCKQMQQHLKFLCDVFVHVQAQGGFADEPRAALRAAHLTLSSRDGRRGSA